jgi:hypothetical protein
MSDTLLSSLLLRSSQLPVKELREPLDEPEQAVFRGLELATAAVFDGLNRQTGDSDAMHQVIALASKTSADIGWAQNTGQLTIPDSSLISGGKGFLSSLLGSREEDILSAVSRESGLRVSSA